MAIVWQPISPFHWVATLMTFILLIACFVGFFNERWQNIANSRIRYLSIITLTITGSVAITVGIWNPVQQTLPILQDYHLSVVIDVSDSVLRGGDWPSNQRRVADFVRNGMQNLPDDISLDSSASIILFGDGVQTIHTTLGNLSDRVRQLTESQFANRSGTNIRQALSHAADVIARNGNRGEILLVTDGYQTTTGATDAVIDISRQGIVLSVIPLSASSPHLGITALNLPRQATALQAITLRGVIENHSPTDADIRFDILQNPNLLREDSLFGVTYLTEVETLIPAQDYGNFKQSLFFEGIGIQFVDVMLQSPADQTIIHQRRLFTHVVRPIQVLAYGNSTWRGGISSDVAIVTPDENPHNLDTVDLTQYDAVVINGLPSSQFNPQGIERLAHAIEENSLGLMLINGNHQGGDEETETVLKSYKETLLDPLLPVETDERPYTPEPPSRRVVILIDSSGSMSGWPMEKAKEIATYIINGLLRPQDILDVITFNVDASKIVDQLPMTLSNKQIAISKINGVSAWGGTDPVPALRSLSRDVIENCGLIFISDGEFSRGINARPDCRTTAFGIGTTNLSAISEIADPFVVDGNFRVEEIVMPYFEAEERNKSFEFGSYTPMSFNMMGREDIFIPQLRLEGTAITYRRQDAEVIAMRPKVTDPVLVYRQAGNGVVGVLTTGIPDTWASIPDGQKAVEEWILRTVGYYDRDRYVFDVTDNVNNLDILIEVVSSDGIVPQVGSLQVDIGNKQGRVEPLGSSTFRVNISPDRENYAQLANLVITETGIDALSRPQHIPILIPADGSIQVIQQQEDYSVGTNEPLLKQIVEISGGVYDPDIGYSFFSGSSTIRNVQNYWRIAITLGAGLYLLAIALQRLLRS